MWYWIALAIAAASFAGGWQTRAWKAAADDKDRAATVETERESDRIRKQAAAQQYEAWKAAQRPKTVQTTREVEHAIEVDPWGAQRVPDSVRESLAAAAAGTGAAVADRAVPAVPAASATDESGPGPGLRIGAGLGGGLRRPTEGSR